MENVIMIRKISYGTRKYIRRQKMIIKRLAKNKDEEREMVKQLLRPFYGVQNNIKKD
jgi:hypothetical protein